MISLDVFAGATTQLGSRKAQATPWSIYNENANGIPVMDEEKKKKAEHADAMARYRDKRTNDIDDFLLRYTKLRDANKTAGVVATAKALDDEKDEHILSGSREEQIKQLAEQYGLSENSLSTLNLHAKGDEPLSDKQIEAILEKYDIGALTKDEKAALLAELTAVNALSYEQFIAIMEDTADQGERFDLAEYITSATARLGGEYSERVAAGKTLDQADTRWLEYLGTRLQALSKLNAIVQGGANC